MKRVFNLILFQGILSLISGVLFSQMSFIGRLGISVSHQEYTLLKTWWKAALVVFAIQLFLIIVLGINRKLNNFKSFLIVDLVFIIIGLLGLGYTYWDFTETSHKYMNANFHWGGYLVWIGWFITCFYFLFFGFKSKEKIITSPPTKVSPLNDNTMDVSVKNENIEKSNDDKPTSPLK